MSGTRFVCIHGHFYQPPRENPWLEVIETQDSAWPHHDWNARIAAECYRPNAAQNLAEFPSFELRNNYSAMSFNFGPTLLSWLESERPIIYRHVLAADARSVRLFDGHGSAMAQAFNHTILPLASRRDKETQVEWGIADFEARFGRRPVGMWLAETAVDTETLEVLAEHEIGFTVLAPAQAARIHDGGETRELSERDLRRPHRVELPSGRSVDVFFYDGGLAHAIAFEGLLRGEAGAMVDRLVSCFDDDPDPQLVHVATDGETYGHHYREGARTLAEVLLALEEHPDVELINYAMYRDRFPATTRAEIVEPSSWSCAHGVERWRSDCGCRAGGEEGWRQHWRAPLRDALEALNAELARHFEHRGGALLRDPWRARNRYVQVVLARTQAAVDSFLAAEARPGLSAEKRREALCLLETQRQAQLMFTSCGWFFSELSGTEGVQILRYAARAVELAGQTGLDVEKELLAALERAPTNRDALPNGRAVYERLAVTARVDVPAVLRQWTHSGGEF